MVKSIFSTVLIIAILFLGCQSSLKVDENIVIEETVMTKQLSPKSPTAKFTVKSTATYKYSDNLLREKEENVITRNKKVAINEKYKYSSNNQIIEKSAFFIETGNLFFKEVYSYDNMGNWVSILKKNEAGKTLKQLDVISRKDGITKVKGLEERGEILITVNRNKRDSIVDLSYERGGEKEVRRCIYSRDNNNNIILEKCFNTEGDSLVSLKKNVYNTEDIFWTKRISDIEFEYVDKQKYHYIDSTYRKILR